MELWKFEDKKVRIVLRNEKTFWGTVGDYVWEDDNEKFGCDAIYLYNNADYHDTIMINSDEIKSIEVID